MSSQLQEEVLTFLNAQMGIEQAHLMMGKLEPDLVIACSKFADSLTVLNYYDKADIMKFGLLLGFSIKLHIDAKQIEEYLNGQRKAAT